MITCRLGKGQKQSDGPMAKYSCAGTEQSLNDCSLNVDNNVCQPPASSIIACSKSCIHPNLFNVVIHHI